MRFVGGDHVRVLARVTLLALSAFLTAAWLPSAFAQSTQQAPSAAEIETFRKLPPDQQQAVLEAMGGRNQGTGRQDGSLLMPQTTTAVVDEAVQDIGPPRIAAGATILLEVTLIESTKLDQATLSLLNGRRDRILAGNPYHLDSEGRLALPTLPPMNLTGLTDLQAAQRLSADPRLAGLQFLVTLLPVEPVGVEALKPFGYDFFGEVPTTYAPATDVPVPSDYRIGPGDHINVEFFGKKSARYQLVVNREGTLNVPEFGPIQVVGLSFDEVREEIAQRVSQQSIGVNASVTMGELRSVRIFVVGDVKRPGAYTVSALASITNALFTSGGVSEIGSLRNIQLKRGGSIVAKLDLYELLLRGDTSKDLPLQQGDAILVAPIGSTAAVAGQVRRPAIYEFSPGTTASQLIELAGGVGAEADTRLVRLERIDVNRERVVIDLDLSTAAGRNERLLAGDVITVPKVLADTRGVTLEGHVHRPGGYAWRSGMRLTDLLGSPRVFKLNADQRYVLIRREKLPERRVEVVSADAARAFERRGSQDDPLLENHDRVFVFSRTSDRGPALTELLQELRLQVRDNQPLPIVTISGRVRAPGDYPLEPGMSVGDLIRAGGGLEDAAYATAAELTRYDVVDNQARKTEIVELQLSAATTGTIEADTALRPYDVLVIKETPNWREKESVTLTGEVRFPGTYPLRKGETLSSVIERAGGLTDEAFARGSVFTRQELKDQERQQVDVLVRRLQSDLALLALQGGQTGAKGASPTETMAAGQSLLSQLQSAQPTGRLVVNVEDALRRKGGEEDIELRSGDVLVVPRQKQYVTVIGEVQNATAHVYKSGLDRGDYIALSGGTTPRADQKRIYVVRANGSVVASESSSWFGRDGRLEPGDTVVVPIDAERMRPLPLWTAVTTIIYNMAVAVAAIGSL